MPPSGAALPPDVLWEPLAPAALPAEWEAEPPSAATSIIGAGTGIVGAAIWERNESPTGATAGRAEAAAGAEKEKGIEPAMGPPNENEGVLSCGAEALEDVEVVPGLRKLLGRAAADGFLAKCGSALVSSLELSYRPEGIGFHRPFKFCCPVAGRAGKLEEDWKLGAAAGPGFFCSGTQKLVRPLVDEEAIVYTMFLIYWG
jgi:hypothetical protein